LCGSLVHAQLAHSLSLNDICDDLRNHSGALSTVRAATPPSRNGLSHANRNRNADMAEELFWSVLGDMQAQAPAFGMGRKYVGFPRRFKRTINTLNERDVFWVTRAKDNMAYEIVGQQTAPAGPILLDAKIRLCVDKSRADYPDLIRLVVALVEVDGEETIMSFITNNFDWAPSSICDLYKCRWGVEVFFKQIKQTLQLADFLGHNEEAIRWQVWTALLTYVLLRFIAYRSGWTRSFARIFTVLRSVLWDRLDMYSVLKFCGTVPDPQPLRTSPGQAYLPGFAP